MAVPGLRVRTELLLLLVLATCSSAFAQPAQQKTLSEIRKVGSFSGTGFVEDIQPGEIIIRREDGRRKSFLVQNRDERFISLDGNDYIVSMPSRIAVEGNLPGELLEQGMVVRFRGEINRAGKTGRPVDNIEVVQGDRSSLLIKPETQPTGSQFVECEFVGIIQRFFDQKMYLVVPKTNLTPRERIFVRVADNAVFSIESNDLNRVRGGDRVVAFSGDRMANGAMVIRDIAVELTAERNVATPSWSDQLYLKHSQLSDEPVDPRQEVSDHFILYTDISPRSAAVLLDKLETMHGFLARYFRKKPREPIECYVVDDVAKFKGSIPPIGLEKISRGTGVTSSQSFTLRRGNRKSGKQTRSIVYSCDDHSVVQHEAVHAWCSMAFGSTGPVWYAEGMAEVGQYWAPDQPEIRVDPVVIEYLTRNSKKTIREIVAAGQITGDSWKAYAWRWALCHLLLQNPNYSKRFRELGVNLMAGKTDSFYKAFGNQIDRIGFEYDQFVRNFDNGYRADLCVWQWIDEPQLIESRAMKRIAARSGWQATGWQLEAGQSYDFICPVLPDESNKKRPQTWSIRPDLAPVSPAGDSAGRGTLVGAILSGFELSDEFEIGSARSAFKSPASGQLYLRCRDDWNAIGDNDGQVVLYVRRSARD